MTQCRAALDVTLSTSRRTTHSLRCAENDGHLGDHRTASGSTWRSRLARIVRDEGPDLAVTEP